MFVTFQALRDIMQHGRKILRNDVYCVLPVLIDLTSMHAGRYLIHNAMAGNLSVC